MSIEAMKQALEALEHEANIGNDNAYQRERDALNAAIEAAKKQEPVAWMDASETALSWENYLDGMKPLYTAPPAVQREWVGLTDEEVDGLWEMAKLFAPAKHFYLLIEAKLKEKNT